MGNLEQFIIFKKGTNLVECTVGGGQGGCKTETVLLDINENTDKLLLCNTKEEVINKIEGYKKFWEEYKGRAALYWYDDKTTPYELGILKITSNDGVIESVNIVEI